MLSFTKHIRNWFFTKVFNKNRFRNGDTPTEDEFSMLTASVGFLLEDDATTNKIGFVRMSTDCNSTSQFSNTINSSIPNKCTEDTLAVSPSSLQYVQFPVYAISEFYPMENVSVLGTVTIQPLGTNVSTEFYAILSAASFDWTDATVVNWIEANLLPPNYRICDGRNVSFTNLCGVNCNMTLPDLRAKFVRGITNTSLNPSGTATQQEEMRLGKTGGVNSHNLIHSHSIYSIQLETVLDIDPFTLTLAQLPAHTHTYNEAISVVETSASQLVQQSGTDTTTITYLTDAVLDTNVSNTGSAGSGDAIDLDVNCNNNLVTTHQLGGENPSCYNPPVVDLQNVSTDPNNFVLPFTYNGCTAYERDNRPSFMSLYFIQRIY